ncbi:heme exporter protein CcmD [Alloyangia pacifica]|uniref:Heme exporter protein D n=1 Tax=Alloyangia pacifica TaxID=311180 RepID=A0A1I6WLA1_9RHOB|nr:heme exporter protein CcmD [Alloyangia pacifica]SDI90910.1 heme exporter protein D [Alloyangia pacifica]SFT26757.1 heme exporter protein D [Alloyangia pacifica]
MTPDLGKYAFAVLASYGVSLGLIIALVALSLRRARRTRAELEKIEERVKRHG